MMYRRQGHTPVGSVPTALEDKGFKPKLRNILLSEVSFSSGLDILFFAV
jgi:hypothetical protein